MFMSMQWPPIYVNSDGLLYVSTTMISVKRLQQWQPGHIMRINTQFFGKAIRLRSLLEGPLACDERALGMGTINEGVIDKEMLTSFSNGILGTHRQVQIRNNAQTCTKNQQGNIGDGGINVVFLDKYTKQRCIENRRWQTSSFWRGAQSIGTLNISDGIDVIFLKRHIKHKHWHLRSTQIKIFKNKALWASQTQTHIDLEKKTL